ncbi:unnamed protein product [Caenorhabditis auriculariae]|uniref:WD repeat and FYVE domain-containing protein 3 n=1 Tax=Caenorhabditis auriculariae TaxID=2777116 RepID=A0A8S1H4Z1_9PELO|nr:unnamed protein product [Caenorhabditis auriculariae]
MWLWMLQPFVHLTCIGFMLALTLILCAKSSTGRKSYEKQVSSLRSPLQPTAGEEKSVAEKFSAPSVTSKCSEEKKCKSEKSTRRDSMIDSLKVMKGRKVQKPAAPRSLKKTEAESDSQHTEIINIPLGNAEQKVSSITKLTAPSKLKKNDKEAIDQKVTFAKKMTNKKKYSDKSVFGIIIFYLEERKREIDVCQMRNEHYGFADTSVESCKMNDGNDRTLSLLHLRKTFSEYLKVPISGARCADPSRLLPLFSKVTSMYTPAQLLVEFKEIVHFSSFLCSVLVKEVRQRAANEGTAEAALSIAQYLRPSSSAKGWSILSAIDFLIASEDEVMIDAACKVALPSTLVKTIYLFFDLPADESSSKDDESLCAVVTSIMQRMCVYRCVSDELVRKDDLLLLFVGTTSPVAKHNVLWRKTTARLLEIIAAKSFTPSVAKYVMAKKCLRTAVKNLANCQVEAQDAAEAIICIFCVLKDSARLTNQLLDEFVECNGYTTVKEFLLRNENDDELVRNILLMTISLITSGASEMMPQYTSGLIQLPNFQLPLPAGNGLSVRNLDAFALLYHVFLESRNERVCGTVVDIIHSIYTCDPANFFILDKDYPLVIFIEQMERKQDSVRTKLLELVELALFQLSHIPCRELIGCCVLMKTEIASGRTSICTGIVQSFFRLLTVDSVIKDAFREIGLLDTLCFIIKQIFEAKKARNITLGEQKLCLLSTDLLTVIIKSNVENAKMFTECFGPKILLKVVSEVEEDWRSSLLQLTKQLLIIAPTDQYLTGIIQVLNDCSPEENLNLCENLLKALLGVVRESHKIRMQFRKTGGYLALMGLLLGLEKKFAQVEPDEKRIPKLFCDLMEFVHLIFKITTLSMRFEPSNARYFTSEVTWESLASVLRLTGAFSEVIEVQTDGQQWKTSTGAVSNELRACHSVFRMDENAEAGLLPDNMPTKIFFACSFIRLIFNMALDNYEKMSSDVHWANMESFEESIVSWTSSVLVHPGAVLAILNLLPSVVCDDFKWTISAQYYVSLLLKALLKPERNQQLMCQVEMPKVLLTSAKKLFLCEDHILLHPFYYLLERLSYQSLQPNQLRHFLRLDNPLCCRNLDPVDGEEPFLPNEGGPVPLQRVKALVSMMTPRDQRLGTSPSFVEFDMSLEGFGALFLPSIAPSFSSTKSERVFPPLNGFTFSTWLYLDSASDKKLDAHPLRLLTITRSASLQDERRKQTTQLACFTMQLSPIDNSLLISTEEHDQPGADLEKEAKFQSEKLIRVTLADVVRNMEWMHICVVMTRSVLKPSQVSVYVNGRHVSTQKLLYVVQNAGGAAAQLAQTHAVNAVVGTLPSLRRPSRLRFRLGLTFFAEEPLPAETVKTIYLLQPHYIGNFQTAGLDRSSLLQEEKMVFSLSGAATQELTLAKIRTIFGKLDAEMLSQQLGISPNDTSTPLRILTNTAAHAPGPGRTFGGVVVGYLGMRTFTPRPVPCLLDSIGGFSCLYGLIAMSTDSEGLYASLKALVSAIRSNPSLHSTINSHSAYQTLAILLEDKAKILNSHIMHMVFNITGTADSSREISQIPHPQAFEDVLCDLDVWKNAPEEIHRMLFDHFYELITDHQRENLMVVRRSPLLSRLLLVVFDNVRLVRSTHDVVFNLISAIVQPSCDSRSVLKLGQIIAATLPTSDSECLEESKLPFHISEIQTLLADQKSPDSLTSLLLHRVYVRNRLLNIVANFLSHSNASLKQQMCEQLVRVLGFDWLMALMSLKVHAGTLFLSLRILLSILSQPTLLSKFKEGTCNGGWLSDADSVVRNRAAVVLGFSVSAHGGSVGSKIDINPEIQNCSGFAALEHLMASHASKTFPYYAMLSILVNQPVKEFRFCEQFNIELVWTHVFGLSSNSSVYEAISSKDFCFEALIPLFSMVRAAIYCGSEALEGWHVSYPATVIQMVTFLYQNSSQFFMIAHSEEFILALFSTLIPNTNAMGVRSESSDRDSGTPDPEKMAQFLAQPNVRIVLDFLKKVLCDNLQVNQSKTESAIDVLIDNVAENGLTRKTQVYCLTHLVYMVLEHVVSTDLLSSSALSPSISTQPLAQVGVNVSLLCGRVVDGLWNGLFSGDSLRLLNAMYHVHAIAVRKENKVINVDHLTNSIMRCTLFVLSRPIDCVPVQLSVLDALSYVISKRYIFLASNEAWFFASLTHLVFMLSVTPDVLVHEEAPLERASAQVAMCASRVWTDVIVAKKAILEEMFKRTIVSELNAARALLAHAAGVQWQTFVDSQLHALHNNTSKDLQQQISSKFNRVASGISRFASKRALSTTQPSVGSAPWKNVSADAQVIFLWLRVHVSLLKELVRAQSSRYHEWHAHVRKWCMHDWHQWEADLTRERGVWGPEKASSLDKYKLDLTEGPSRIRRKLIPHRYFYHIYPYRPHLDEPSAKAQRAKVAISHDSQRYYEACLARRKPTLDQRIIDTSFSTSTPSEEKPPFTFQDLAQINSSLIRRLSISQIQREDSEPEGEAKEISVDEPSVDEETQEDQNSGERLKEDEGKKEEKEEKKRGPDNQTLLRLLEQGEQLHSMFRCARIQGLETSEGLLLFGKEHFYVVDGFTLLKTKEIRDLDFLSQELHDPIVPYQATGTTNAPKSSRLCSKFSYQLIREVHKRRYLLQPIALEVFSSDGRNYLLAFPKKIRDRVHDKLTSMAHKLTVGGSDSIGGQKANMAIEMSGRTSLINSLIGQQSVTQRWLNGQITNFQYLMHLNTLAGRSYNDLSQYPIFPWVLSDYSSPHLDFTNPKIYRNFSKPMGAQSPERLQQFLKRFREWDDPTGETPPYMYGTHYSSAMIVVSYLVRLEPFTQQFLSLQGGHFDLADRMFHSVGDAWTSASRNNMADVKELIPEFFTLPEMFDNKDRFDLGVKQNGVQVDNVILPVWAHGDAREFVRLHRQALESDYVSSHLHEWIDLIFGYKQFGDEAIKANNLFHHLFYEGSVDFESIDDPLTRNATIGFVNNFGQIPTQLFKKPHPQKKVNILEGFSNTPGVTTSKLFYHSVQSLKAPQSPFKELRSAVGTVVQNEKFGVVALEQNKVMIEGSRFLCWGLSDRSIRLGSLDSDKSQCVYEMCETDEVTCVAVGDESTLFCGSTSGCVTVWKINYKPVGLKKIKVLDGHSDAVTCLVSCSAHTLLVSASRDCTVLLWHQSQLSLIRQLAVHSQPVVALAVNETTGDIATACSTFLHVWSVNGELLSVTNTCDTSPAVDPLQMIISLSFSTVNEWDTDNVIMCGTSDGVVKIFSCVVVENDGTMEFPNINSRRTKEVLPVHAKLEKQRRRLRVAGSEETISSVETSQSSEVPPSPAHTTDQVPAINGPKFVRVLVQRAALTMHTAFNRPDNIHPAPITVIAPSRDHRALFVGDGIGRVWCWQSGEDGSRADHWVQDMARQRCDNCKHNFSLADRKHHCRNCGQIFCAKCSRFESHITRMNISRPVRVCHNCFVRLKTQSVM